MQQCGRTPVPDGDRFCGLVKLEIEMQLVAPGAKYGACNKGRNIYLNIALLLNMIRLIG